MVNYVMLIIRLRHDWHLHCKRRCFLCIPREDQLMVFLIVFPADFIIGATGLHGENILVKSVIHLDTAVRRERIFSVI